MRSARICLLWISLLLPGFASLDADAQSLLPQTAGSKVRFSAMVELPKAYLSGVCVMVNDDGVLKGSFFNEFGISYMDFSYSVEKDKVKLHSVQSMMDKWYIRKALRHDLRMLIHQMEKGVGEYENKRRKMTYRFTPLTDDEPENLEENDTEE